MDARVLGYADSFKLYFFFSVVLVCIALLEVWGRSKTQCYTNGQLSVEIGKESF